MDRQPPAVEVIRLVAEQIEKLTIHEGGHEIESAVRIRQDHKQRCLLVAQGASRAPQEMRMDFKVLPETSCQGLFIKKISNSIICCTMLVVYVIWLYN